MPNAANRTFRYQDFDLDELAAAKAGRLTSVCLPARDEAATVGPIVEAIRSLADRTGLIDEILVIDDHSTDGTANVAAAAGAKVIEAAEILPEYGEGHGKGEALWKSLYVAEGDLIAWCDADITNFEPHFVIGLLGPLITRPELAFVKGYYERPIDDDRDARAAVPPGPAALQGGRVTELVARPLLSLLFPELTAIAQPLAGEYAGRRDVLEQLPFAQGYGVEIALLIDLAASFGPESIGQVDLGCRRHRNRPLDELAPQALAILQTVLVRIDPQLIGDTATLARPGHPPVEVEVGERPPLVTVPAYRQRRAR